MTVFIDNAEFTQRLQRENSELLAENRKLRNEIAALQPAQSKSTIEKCVICGNYSDGGTYGELFPLCFECYSGRAEDIHKYLEMLEKGQEQ